MLQQTLFKAEHPVPSSVPSAKNGVIYTKTWVVDLILDLAGYTDDFRLSDLFLIEPSAGDGSFLIPAVRRLATSVKKQGGHLADCARCIVAFELDPNTAEASRRSIRETLVACGATCSDAELLADSWVRCGDFLLESTHLIGQADLVIGNPPYIRLEDLPRGGAEYREAFETMIGRADIYVAFFEAALRLLKPNAVCGFICADRWMFNQYGAALRRYVTSIFSVDIVIQMHNADAFETQVSAYPAVSIIRRAPQGPTVVSSLEAGAEQLGGRCLASEIKTILKTGKSSELKGLNASRVETWFKGEEPWPLISPEKIALLKRLEREFPTLEETGAIVGIGVATGADKVFVTKDASLVEPDRLLPLAMACDVRGSKVEWSGHYLVDPWENGKLVNLERYPRLRDFLESHRSKLETRHVGKRSSETWFRTIDRVNHSLTAQPKLYLPDFKGRIAPVLDRGKTYPHHNLYFIAPHGWDAEVLGGLLLSDVAQFFIEAYGVRMRGGYLRFQAQYLRRIRVPHPASVSDDDSEALRLAFSTHDVAMANGIARLNYRLTSSEVALLVA